MSLQDDPKRNNNRFADLVKNAKDSKELRKGPEIPTNCTTFVCHPVTTLNK